MFYTIRPKGRGWTTEVLAERLADVLHGRHAQPWEKDHDPGAWVLSNGNNEFLRPAGEDGVWSLQFRYGAPPGFADLVSDRVGPCVVAASNG